MSIEFRCSRCGKLLRTGDDTAGRMAQCPECGAQTQVPQSVMGEPLPSGGSDYPVQESLQGTGNQGPYQPVAGYTPAQGHTTNTVYALNRVSAPATCLIVTAVLGLCLQAMRLLATALNMGAAVAVPRDFAPMLVIGPIAIVFISIAVFMGLVVLFGALKMKALDNYGFAIATSILSMIPIVSPCCCLGLPFGIWALVVLSDPAVKAAFKN
jgi:hypothetical protein